MPVQRFPYLLISAFLVSAITALHLTRTHRIQAEQSQPFGRYNSYQILARTAPFCPLFTNQANDLRLSASKLELQSESSRHYWAVECTDAAGNYVASFTWDADSGDLYLAGHRPSRPSESDATPLSRGEAIEIARRWMNDLGIARQAPRWRLTHTPERRHNLWHVGWEAEEQEAFIQIDLRSGDLLQARSWRRHGQRKAGLAP